VKDSCGGQIAATHRGLPPRVCARFDSEPVGASGCGPRVRRRVDGNADRSILQAVDSTSERPALALPVRVVVRRGGRGRRGTRSPSRRWAATAAAIAAASASSACSGIDRPSRTADTPGAVSPDLGATSSDSDASVAIRSGCCRASSQVPPSASPSASSGRRSAVRVSVGSITSSTKPRSAAVYGFANSSRYSSMSSCRRASGSSAAANSSR